MNFKREEDQQAEIAEALDNYSPDNESVDDASANDNERKSQATILVELAARATLFHDSDGNGYARLTVGNHYENWPIRSRGFKDWLSHGFYLREGRAPNVTAVNDGLATISGQARFEGSECEVATRIASHGGAIYLDLCDDAWRAVEIDATGWRTVTDPPVRFIRSRGMLPLPQPEHGDAELIWHYVNVCDADKPLVRGWLDAALRPTGPYPILVLQGEQGTGKSTQAKVLRSLVDPSRAPLRTAPKDERDLMIAGRNGWIIALDNLSGLPSWVSDSLCRIATGGGFATRELYSDADEVLIDIQRPIVLNGIDDIATRQDLIDRALIVNLDPIPESQRVEESRFWAEFNRARPQILGACLDRISRAIRDIDHVQLDHLPRMADFARWAHAAGGGDKFMATYRANRQDAIAAGLEGSPVAQAIRRLVDDRESFSDTATVLLTELERYADRSHLTLRSWPKSARSLSSQLRRLATALRAVGIEATTDRVGKNRTRTWRIQKVADFASKPSVASASMQNQEVTAESADAKRTQSDDSGRKNHSLRPPVNACFQRKADEADEADANPPNFYKPSREVI